tara:strand:+ start:170 stop:409 length:240 start_codon:yes stop_codon:yes gene_type:complete
VAHLSEKEFELYKQAATLKSADSYFNLGAMYACRGDDFYHEAVMWYRAAGYKGHTGAKKVLSAIKKIKQKKPPWYKKFF